MRSRSAATDEDGFTLTDILFGTMFRAGLVPALETAKAAGGGYRYLVALVTGLAIGGCTTVSAWRLCHLIRGRLRDPPTARERLPLVGFYLFLFLGIFATMGLSHRVINVLFSILGAM